MFKCPKCDKEIDHLDAEVKETTSYVVRLPADDEKESADYNPGTGLVWELDAIRSPEDSFFCPNCNEVLTTDEETAARMLREGK